MQWHRDTFTEPDFTLERGDRLAEMTLAFETYGTRADDGGNAILLCHGYTSSQHGAGDARGWFQGLVGDGKAIDTERYFVVCPNMLGSAYGSTGPSSIDPATGETYGPDFPEITTGDMVAAQARLLRHLGVGQMAAVIGFSYGGHLTFEWGIQHPEAMRALVVTASGIKSRGGSELLDQLQARFGACPGWNGGRYYGAARESGVHDALVAQRLETLRTYGLVPHLRETLNDAAAVTAHLDTLAEEWAAAFDANALFALRRALIGFDLGDKTAAIKAPLLYVLSRTDKLFPPALAAPTMALLDAAGVAASYFEIDSECGHMAPGVDWPKWSDALGNFLATHVG